MSKSHRVQWIYAADATIDDGRVVEGHDNCRAPYVGESGRLYIETFDGVFNNVRTYAKGEWQSVTITVKGV